MGEATMKLPVEEKMKYEQGDEGSSFGRKSSEINTTILNIFIDKLGLRKGELAKRYRPEEFSGGEARTIKNPKGMLKKRMAIGAHTDFGSLSFLHNRLGGLQVLPPGVDEWHRCPNMPSAASATRSQFSLAESYTPTFTDTPPGAQANLERWSQEFFTRPGDSTVLEPLSAFSPAIAEAVKRNGDKKLDTGGVTAREWLTRRNKNQRIKNRKVCFRPLEGHTLGRKHDADAYVLKRPET
ncbi:hypothetical protein V5O48_018585 [Marasmius crinis-equi]|uniref:DUF2235 domain-containing protein n=1 Tax=Marasmius crinis-equi TaxID=585013 RepID=A0ABR3EKS5_9AGAR